MVGDVPTGEIRLSSADYETWRLLSMTVTVNPTKTYDEAIQEASNTISCGAAGRLPW